MSIGDNNPYSIDTDYNSATGDFAPTSGRVGVAPAGNQAGRAALFKDNAGLLSLANVDALDNLLVNPVNPKGAALQVYTGQPVPVTTSQYGTLIMGRQNIASSPTYQPVSIDSQGYLLTASAGKPSFRAVASGVTCSQGKVLLSIVNAGSIVLRIANVSMFVQAQSQTATNSGSVLGLSGTTTSIPYYPLFCEMYRITSHTKGTSATQLNPVSCDTSDTLDTTTTCYSGSTTSATAGLLHRRDALQASNTGVEWYRVMCTTEKNIACRPGEGISVVCVTNGQVASGSSTSAATVDITVIFSQAAA